MSRVFPSITTLSKSGSTWRSKLLELEHLPVTKVGLFLTGVKNEERTELLRKLLEVKQKKHFTIPFVHAVSTMCEDEYNFLIENFETEAFNLHPISQYPLAHPLSVELRKMIYIENARAWVPLQLNDIDGFAGVCLDLSHLEEARLNDPLVYRMTLKVAAQVGVGANHLSAIGQGEQLADRPWIQYQDHTSRTNNDMDYIFRVPSPYFSRYCALELENPLSEQVQIAQRVGAILGTISVIDAFDKKAA
jgi:hypothetical protein